MKNILDGELLNKYLYLSMMERSELAKKIGTTQDIVGRSGQGGVGALRLNVLLLPRFWRTSWTWTGSPLTSESLAPPPARLNTVSTRQNIANAICWIFLCTILYKIKLTKKSESKVLFPKAFVWRTVFHQGPDTQVLGF